MGLFTNRGLWTPGRHHQYLDYHLRRVEAGLCKRLMVFMPPRHGKSEYSSHFFPAHFLGHFPDRRVILVSYEANFAATWGRKARAALTEHGDIFGVQVDPNSSAADRWDILGWPGGMTTAGVGGPVTGKGADLLILDDVIKNAEEARSPTYREKAWDWYKSTVFTRLEPGAAIVLVQTRWHRDDLPGRMLSEGREFDKQPWEVISLPAIALEADALGRQPGEALWPERWPVEALEVHKRDPYWWQALYQQNPVGEGGTEWPESYFNHAAFWFDDWPANLIVRTLSLDPSKGSDSKLGDYSAYVLYGRDSDGIEYVEADLSNTRDSEEIVDAGMEYVRTFGPDGFAIEGNAFQFLFASLFRDRAEELRLDLPVYLVDNQVKKVVRIRRLTEPLRQKRVRFRNTPGTRLLVQQLRDFPVGEKDDGPDALEMARRLAVELHNEGAVGGGFRRG